MGLPRARALDPLRVPTPHPLREELGDQLSRAHAAGRWEAWDQSIAAALAAPRAGSPALEDEEEEAGAGTEELSGSAGEGGSTAR